MHESRPAVSVDSDHQPGSNHVDAPKASRGWHRRRQTGPNPATQVTDVEIHYGTMFGSAERYAQALAHDISSNCHTRVRVHDLDGFDEDSFASASRLAPSRLFVFVVSTHFAGAPSPSAERFRDWLANLSDGSSTKSAVDNHDPAAGPTTTGASKPSHPRQQAHWFEFLSRLAVSKLFRRRPQPFLGMQFAVFGIGDSVYLTYNAMGKFVDAKLKGLGATRFHQLGLGDCSNDSERAFKEWKAPLLIKLPPKSTKVVLAPLLPSPTSSARKILRKSFSASHLVFPSSTSTVHEDEAFTNRDKPNQLNVPDDSDNEHTDPREPSPDLSVRDLFGRLVRLRFSCRILDAWEATSVHLHALRSDFVAEHSSNTAMSTPRTPRIALFDDAPFADMTPVECTGGSPHAGPVSPLSARLSGKTMTRAATFSVRLLDPETTYVAVSTLAIFPQNCHSKVEQLATAFGYDLNAVVELRADAAHHHSAQLPFPSPCTVRTALIEFLEISSLTRDFVRVAAGFARDPAEHKLLTELASAEAFSARLQDQHRGILDLVGIAPTLRVPLDVLVNFAGTIRPRYFTIASSPQVAPRHLDVAVLLGRPGGPQGLAVSYFERVLASTSGARVPVRGFISSSRFQFKDDGVSPMVLIASGVGFSAMRAILMERLAGWQRAQGAGSQSVSRLKLLPQHILFLGTANEDSMVFGADLRCWEQQLVVKVHYAFSNDRAHPRRYVQDVVAARIDEIVHTVQSSSARVVVCGRTAMVRRVREIFQADQVQRGSAWFDTIRKSARFTEEGYN